MNQCTMVASELIAMQPAIARQNGRGVRLYNQLPASSVANLATLSLDLATFQTILATFFFKAPSDKSSDFWKDLTNFPNVASTVLRARDLELHLSLCLL